MGRGKSNRTRLYYASYAFKDQWLNETLGDRPSERAVSGALGRQLGRSKWFKRYFSAVTNQGADHLNNFRGDLSNDRYSSPAEGLFELALAWPLDHLNTTSKFGHLGKPPNRLNKPANSEETTYRKRAFFYLILVQHFMGKEQAQKLKAIYKTEKVKWRKVRVGSGIKLKGADLAEFRMRLGGHSLLVPPINNDAD